MNVHLQDKTNVRGGDDATFQTPGRRALPWVWAALSMVLALYIFSALRLRPIASFGAFEDDGVYFSSAKALAEGRGYILPGFPGRLPSMKYPELYPLLLAGVWKLDSHFPGNVALAVGTTLGCGCMALLLTFLMLRRWPGLGDWPALGVVLLVGLSSQFIYLSSITVSDIPFMALMLGAAWLAERSLDREPGRGFAAAAGVFAGMSVGLRSLGIPVAAGIGLLLLFRRKFRRLFWFCLPGLPLTLLWSWSAVSGVLGLSLPAFPGDPTRSGWTQTVCYYSSYSCAWRMFVPNFEMLKPVIILNLRYFAQEPGTLLLTPLNVGNKVLGLALVMLLSTATYVGMVRHWRLGGARPVYVIFPLYLLVIVGFAFDPHRYLVVFAPIFIAGLWFEGKRIFDVVAARLRQGCKTDEHIAAGLLGLGALAVAATVALNYAFTLPRAIGRLGRDQMAIIAEERNAYDWLRQHAAPDARVIADEDGLAYLYTGRPSVRAIATLSEAFYLHDQRYAEHDAAHLADVARHVDASYWLTTPYDLPEAPKASRALLLAKQQKLLATAPVVYRSPDGQVVLYDTRCLWAKHAGCSSEPPESSASSSRP